MTTKKTTTQKKKSKPAKRAAVLTGKDIAEAKRRAAPWHMKQVDEEFKKVAQALSLIERTAVKIGWAMDSVRTHWAQLAAPAKNGGKR